jgi:hypothetical protein
MQLLLLQIVLVVPQDMLDLDLAQLAHPLVLLVELQQLIVPVALQVQLISIPHLLEPLLAHVHLALLLLTVQLI